MTVLEAASHIGEVGAGIQVLPNSARVLFSWGLRDALEPYATKPSLCNFLGWKGNHLSAQDYRAYAQACGGAPFWDFYRMNLHKCLLDRAVALGAQMVINARATDFVVSQGEPGDGLAVDDDDDTCMCTVYTADGRTFTGDLVVGADGIHSKLRDVFLGREDPPTPTGDLAYRLLLNTDKMRADPTLRAFVEEPQVNYWLGPDKHAVNYVLRGQAATSRRQTCPTSENNHESNERNEKENNDNYLTEPGLLFNMVLLVPDDLPQGSEHNTLAGNIEEMRAHFADWDPRLPRLLALCDSVLKWRLLIRHGLDDAWSHPSGTFTMLGDAVHATLPYLASGAGMALEDAGVLGLCLGRLHTPVGEKSKGAAGDGRSTTSRTSSSKRTRREQVRRALAVYEACRRARTEAVVERGTYNQWIYHLPDGAEQRARDERLRHFAEVDRAWLAGTATATGEPPRLPAVQETGEDPLPWRYHGVGRWLLTYDMWKDVEERWAASSSGEEEEEKGKDCASRAATGADQEAARL